MTTLAPIYRAKSKISPVFSIPKDSLAKVLNVVKPPQNPLTRSSFISGDKIPLFNQPMRSPMSNDPKIFTLNVAHGKEVSAIFVIR